MLSPRTWLERQVARLRLLFFKEALICLSYTPANLRTTGIEPAISTVREWRASRCTASAQHTPSETRTRFLGLKARAPNLWRMGAKWSG